MIYGQHFDGLLQDLRNEGNYRTFAEILRARGNFPNGVRRIGGQEQPITVWCSNDYLAMGPAPGCSRSDARGAG
jgi:5-aminolevulinate synthase